MFGPYLGPDSKKSGVFGSGFTNGMVLQRSWFSFVVVLVVLSSHWLRFSKH